jgi:hypothetical protein
MKAATITIVSLSLALSACAPAGPSDVLPVEAGHIVAVASATAAQQATEDARATAADVSGRQTATASFAGTEDGLAARETLAAVTMTLQAAQAEFTQQAAQNTGNYRASQAAQTPTAAAVKTQTALTAIVDARQQMQAESWAEFWQTIRLMIVALLAVFGLSFICVAVLDAVTRIKLARMAQQAVIARESFRLLAPGHWAEWAPGDGYSVYPLPGLLDAPAAVIENTPTTPDKAHAWRQAVRLFAWWGDKYGFGVRELGPAGAGVVTDPSWRVLSKLLRAAGVLAEVSTPGEKGKKTGWAADWNYQRLHDELGHGPLTLAYPADDPAPEVRFTVPNTTPQQAQHNTTTQKIVLSK